MDVSGDLTQENVTSLALWWLERSSELVGGPGPSIYLGSPDYWDGHVIVRHFDRAPSPKWPKGRTIITVGGFSEGCKKGALYQGAAPISLIDGERLLDLLIEHRIGVRQRPISLYEVDEAFFVRPLEVDVENEAGPAE